MRILSLLIAIVSLVGCHITSSGTNNSGSVTGSSCSDDTGFGPVPLAANKVWYKGKSKFFVPDHLKNKLVLKDGEFWVSSKVKMVGLIDVNCYEENSKLRLSSIANVNLKRVERAVGRARKVRLFPFEFNLNKTTPQLALERSLQKDKCIKTAVIDVPFEKDKDVVPNDPLFDDSGHMPFLNAPDAWDIFYHVTTGINQNVVVAIVDDGGDMDHPDLVNNLWVNGGEVPGNATDDDGNGYADDINGFNFASDLASPEHEAGNSHGTLVSGFTGAQFNNGAGTTGILGQNIEMMYMNAGGTSSGINRAAAYEGIAYAADNGADVINLSFGSLGEDPNMELLLEDVTTAGVFVSVSAGNSSIDFNGGTFRSPVSYGPLIEGVISVGSVDSDTGLMSSFSNFGSVAVEIGAPGGESGSLGVMTTVPDGTYGRVFGTSFSAPIVAGAAAATIALVFTERLATLRMRSRM